MNKKPLSARAAERPRPSQVEADQGAAEAGEGDDKSLESWQEPGPYDPAGRLGPWEDRRAAGTYAAFSVDAAGQLIIEFNPVLMARLDPAMQLAVFMHEVMHARQFTELLARNGGNLQQARLIWNGFADAHANPNPNVAATRAAQIQYYRNEIQAQREAYRVALEHDVWSQDLQRFNDRYIADYEALLRALGEVP